jgi:nitroreductase
LNYDDLLKLVKDRRSTRRFKPDPIPDEYIDKIIEVARYAPSGFNLQPWEFVILKDQKLKDGIVKYCRDGMENMHKMESTREPWQGTMKPPPPSSDPDGDYSAAPVFILLFGDTRVDAGLPMYRRFDPSLKQEAVRGGLASAFLYMHLAALSLGLASQWVSAVAAPYAHCMIKNLLNIPGEMAIYDMMALGYPASAPKPRLIRERSEITHYGQCSPEAFRTHEQVKEFIRKIRS